MKHTRQLLLGSLLMVCLQLAWSGCVAEGGGGGVGYGGDVWVNDGPWFDGGGRGWYGRDRGAAYVHPSGGNRGGRGAGESHPESGGHPQSGGGHPESGGGHAAENPRH